MHKTSKRSLFYLTQSPPLAHQVSAGKPCSNCRELCPGFELHFWRWVSYSEKQVPFDNTQVIFLLHLLFFFFFFFTKDENHKTCWFLEEKKWSYVWRCFCILWDCWCFLKCTIFFFWINACYVYMKLKYTPAAGSISFKIRGKLYISVAFLILNTYLGAIIWSSVIALKKVEHFKSVLDYLLWKFF